MTILTAILILMVIPYGSLQVLIQETYSNTNTSSSTFGSTNLLSFEFINVFNTTQNTSYSYCQRIRGWLQVEVTGNYTFYTSCSNPCQLYLSTSNDPANKTLVANQTIPSGFSKWNNRNVTKYLQGYWRYYIEGIMCHLFTPDNFSVGMQQQGKETLISPISTEWLSPMRIDKCPSSCNPMKNEKCVSVNGTYVICTCENGYVYYNGAGNVSCIKNSECQVNCTNSTCKDLNSTLQRFCPVGFFFNVTLNICQDIDECLMNCKYNKSTCVNQIGSFNCSCPEGSKYNISIRDCEDIDECLMNCKYNKSTCVNQIGSFNCSCPEGSKYNISIRDCEVIFEWLLSDPYLSDVWANNSESAIFYWQYRISEAVDITQLSLFLVTCGYTNASNIVGLAHKNNITELMQSVNETVFGQRKAAINSANSRIVGFKINRVQKNDPITYQCQAIVSQKYGAQFFFKSPTSILHILDPPVFINCLENIEPVIRSYDLEITCLVVGNPTPELRCQLFSMTGQILDSLPSSGFSKQNLTIASFKAVQSDAHTISCTAVGNRTGLSVKNVTFTIKSNLSFTQPSSTYFTSVEKSSILSTLSFVTPTQVSTQDCIQSKTLNCTQDIACGKGIIVIGNKAWMDQYFNSSTNEYKNFAELVKSQVKLGFSSITKNNVVVEVQNFSQSPIKDLNITVYFDVYMSRITENSRLETCKQMKKVIFGLTPLKVLYADVKPCDCCMEETVGSKAFTGSYTFPVTLVNTFSEEMVSIPCVYNDSLLFNRQCIRGGPLDIPYWGVADISMCPTQTKTSKDLLKLEMRNFTDANAEEIATTLSDVLIDGDITHEYDIKMVSQVVDNIVNLNASSDKITSDVLSSVDVILGANTEVMTLANKIFNSSAKFLSSLETLAKQQTKNITIGGKNLAFMSFSPKRPEPLYISASVNTNNLSLSISNQSLKNTSENLQAFIFLPVDVFNGRSGRVYSYAYNKNTFFKENDSNNYTVVSLVLSATVNGLKVVNSTAPINIYFNTNASGTKWCGFWKPENNTWSSEGCQIVGSSLSTDVQCQCNHLTNFALILDADQSGKNPLELQIVTWIGCGISIAGLFITIISHIAFRKLRTQLAPKILIALSSNLMFTLILFLALVEKTKPRALCQAVASLIQFFLLSTFCWMIVEGFNLYRMFVKVFIGSSSPKIFMLKSSAFALGVPLIITVVTAAVKPDSLGPATDNDPAICVVQGVPFYFAVLLPVCVVLLGNIVVLIFVHKRIIDCSKLSKDLKSKKNKGFMNVRIAFSFSILLGITWLFAVLAVGSLRDVFQWLFCIFNSLQGFFIFVFYTLRNKEIKQQWLSIFGKKDTTVSTRSTQEIPISSRESESFAKLDTSFKSIGFSKNKGYQMEGNY